MKAQLLLVTALTFVVGGYLYFQQNEVIAAPSLEECIEQIISKTEGEAQSAANREMRFQCAMRSRPVLEEGNLTPDQEQRLEAARISAAERRNSELIERYPDTMISRLIQGGDTANRNEVFDATRTALSKMDCTADHFLNEAGWTRSTNYEGAGERFFVWCGTGNRVYWDTTQNSVFRQ